MLHHRQRLTLDVEPGEHLAAIHACLDNLQRHQAPDWFGLLGQVDGAHAPLADDLDQSVRADRRVEIWGGDAIRSGFLVVDWRRPALGMFGIGCRLSGLEEPFGLAVGPQKRLHSLAKVRGGCAGLVEVSGPILVWISLESVREDGQEVAIGVSHSGAYPFRVVASLLNVPRAGPEYATFLLFRFLGRESFRTECVAEPGPCEHPFSVGCPCGNTERRRRFCQGQPGEEPQFHQFGRTGIGRGQSLERLVQAEKIFVMGLERVAKVLQIDPFAIAASLEPTAVSCPIDQDPAHRLCRRSQEVPTAVPAGVVGPNEPYVSLVDQIGRLEQMAGLLSCELLRGQSAELIIHQR